MRTETQLKLSGIVVTALFLRDNSNPAAVAVVVQILPRVDSSTVYPDPFPLVLPMNSNGRNPSTTCKLTTAGQPKPLC